MSKQTAVRAVIRATIEPDIGDDGIPRCQERCPQHDGKRCRVLGARPRDICDPAMDDMAAVIERAAAALGIR